MHAHPATARTTIRRLALWLATALALIGCAGTTDTGADSADTADSDLRTIEVGMVDIAFDPEVIEVADGETVRLRFTNDGQLPHDAFIGDDTAQTEHGEEMTDTTDAHGGGHGGENPDAVTVEPGDTADLIHTFEAGETVLIGCHQVGHYEAGMVLDVTVT